MLANGGTRMTEKHRVDALPTALTITVVIPTWRRPRELRRCLAGLAQQRRAPEEILIVVRPEDHETIEAIGRAGREFPALPIRAVHVEKPGLGQALNAGLSAATGDVVSCTDDDAVPRPDWLERIARHFEDAGVAGVGGRDWVHHDGVLDDAEAGPVGCITAFGRIIGNHHRGAGAARECQILKGANMSYRRAAVGSLRFDDRLLGTGSQPHNEVGFCLRLGRTSGRLLYDPAVAVDHFLAGRQADQRGSERDPGDVRAAAHNQFLGVITGLRGRQRWVTALYQLLVGTREDPGPVLWVERLARDRSDRLVTQRMKAATAGRLEALRSARRGPAERDTVAGNNALVGGRS